MGLLRHECELRDFLVWVSHAAERQRAVDVALRLMVGSRFGWLSQMVPGSGRPTCLATAHRDLCQGFVRSILKPWSLAAARWSRAGFAMDIAIHPHGDANRLGGGQSTDLGARWPAFFGTTNVEGAAR